MFSHTKGKIDNGDTGDVACDSYHHFREDVQLLRDMQVNFCVVSRPDSPNSRTRRSLTVRVICRPYWVTGGHRGLLLFSLSVDLIVPTGGPQRSLTVRVVCRPNCPYSRTHGSVTVCVVCRPYCPYWGTQRSLTVRVVCRPYCPYPRTHGSLAVRVVCRPDCLYPRTHGSPAVHVVCRPY